MQTEYGHLYFKKNVNVVGVYGLFENLPLNTEQIKITKDYKDFNPNYNYAVLDVKSGEAPYVTVGSIWLYPDGQTMVRMTRRLARRIACFIISLC